MNVYNAHGSAALSNYHMGHKTCSGRPRSPTKALSTVCAQRTEGFENMIRDPVVAEIEAVIKVVIIFRYSLNLVF